MKLRTRLEGVAWLTGGLTAGLVILAVVSGATATTHQHNYQTPAGDEITSTTPAPTTSLSPTPQVFKVAPTTSKPAAKRALVQPMDETDPTVDPTTDTPTPTDPTTDPVPTDTMPTDDGTQGPGGFTAPPPPVNHPTPTRPGQHTPSGQPND